MRIAEPLPRGLAGVWLDLRQPGCPDERALSLLRSQAHLSTPALRQFARDFAFAVARAACAQRPALRATFELVGRRSDLGRVRHEVGERLDVALRKDGIRATVTIAELRKLAWEAFEDLAERELKRGSLRRRPHRASSSA
jgi:hypothetical protein